MFAHNNATWKKYFAYSSINFGFSLLGMTVATLLMYYYTDVLMLPAVAVSVILFSARLFDGVVDPFLGHYMDKRSTKLGKYRGYVIYCGPLACITFLLLFAGAPFTPFMGIARIVWCLLLYLAFTLAFSFIEVASLPMLASFETREKRSTANTLKIAACIAATLLAVIFSAKLVQLFGSRSEQSGYARMAAAFAFVAFVSLLFGGFGFREDHYANTSAEETTGTLDTKRAIATVLRERSIFFLLSMYLCVDAAAAFKMQAGIYYLKYNLARPELTGLFLGSSIVVSLLAQPLVLLCSHRFEVRTLMVYGCFISAAAMLLIGLSGSSVTMIIAFNCVYGLASAFPANLVFSHMVDLSDQLGKKEGKPYGGVVNAFIGLASRVGASLASALLSLILFATAYVPNQTQSGKTLLGIAVGFVALPVATLLLGGGCAAWSFRGIRGMEPRPEPSAEFFSSEAEV
ncbi:MFS transporter [Synergistaceae bacterium OttesenSCG-928-I11]|nr:MFS transporter [Synergistaceae bacterium OttesenSCG-928-I11]